MIGEEIQQAVNGDSLELLLRMQQSDANSEHIQNRSSKRLGVQCKVALSRGNSRERLKAPISGICGDLSRGGCRVITHLPPRVGDIYWIGFDRNMVDVPPTFGRCLRCRLLREDAFESGFQFFNEIALTQELEQAESDLVDLI